MLRNLHLILIVAVACEVRKANFKETKFLQRAGDTLSGICKANSMEQIRNANFSASLRDSSKNSKNSLKKPKVSSPSGREPLVLYKARTSYCRARRLGAPWEGLQWLLFARCFEGAGTFVWIKRILCR